MSISVCRLDCYYCNFESPLIYSESPDIVYAFRRLSLLTEGNWINIRCFLLDVCNAWWGEQLLCWVGQHTMTQWRFLCVGQHSSVFRVCSTLTKVISLSLTLSPSANWTGLTEMGERSCDLAFRRSQLARAGMSPAILLTPDAQGRARIACTCHGRR